MKVGLLESRAARLSGYWTAYLNELGVELVPSALSDAEALTLGRESLPGEPVQVQLALGRILALGRVDAALLPQWPHVRGDAWGEALSELLPRRFSGLPTLIALPDTTGGLDSAATEIGLRLSQNPGGVRLALERVKPKLRLREEMPPLAMGSKSTVAVIGPRALLAEPELSGGLLAALNGLDVYPVLSSTLPLETVLSRAERMDNARTATPGEKELFGAASLLSGKSGVRGLIFAAPARDGAHHDALSRLAAGSHKHTLVLSVDAGQTQWPELRAFVERIQSGASARPQNASLDPAGDEPA